MKIKIIFIGILIFFPVVILTSCVSTREIDDLRYSLESTNTSLNARIDNLQDSIGKSADEKINAMRLTLAQSGAELDKLKGEVREIAGNVEDDHQLVTRIVEKDLSEQDSIKKSLSEITRRMTLLEDTIRQMGGNIAPDMSGGNGSSSGLSSEQAIPSSSSSYETNEPQDLSYNKEPPTQQALYDSILSRYKNGKYEETISGFRDFISKYPDSDLSDNSLFWIGEAYAALKQYDQAILAYQEVVEKYPKGNKVPNAILSQAMAFNAINDNISARLLLKKIIKDYPGSNEATSAKIKLDSLK